jgi:zinc protease
LLDVLREELGGTYTVSVNGAADRIPRQEYQISIRFGGDPQRVEGLAKRVFEEVEKYKANGPTEKELEDEKAAMIREFETSSKQNGFLLGQIAAKYQSGEDVAGIWAAPELYRNIDVATVQTAAKSYLNTSNYVRVTLLPEKK